MDNKDRNGFKKSSLGKLSQLYNTYKGDMSFIDPIPTRWNQFDLINQRDQFGINEVRPGLTGFAQVNG